MSEQASALVVGTTELLFPVRQAGIGVFGPLQRMFYDVSRDGQRILVNLPTGGEAAAMPAITVVTNWQEALKK